MDGSGAYAFSECHIARSVFCSGLGQALVYSQWGYSYHRYPRDVYPQAIEALRRALALDPKLALSHALMGIIHLNYNRDWVSASASSTRHLHLIRRMRKRTIGYRTTGSDWGISSALRKKASAPSPATR